MKRSTVLKRSAIASAASLLLVQNLPSATAAGPSGTFTGAPANTLYGPVVVQIDVLNGQLTSARALQYPVGDSVSQQINSVAIPLLIQETLAAQSANIMGVSVASYTSQGWYNSLVSALAQVASTPAPVPAPAQSVNSNSAMDAATELTDAANASTNAANTVADLADAATQAAQNTGNTADAALAAVTAAQQTGQYSAAVLSQAQGVLASYQNDLTTAGSSLNNFSFVTVFFIGTDPLTKSQVTATGYISAAAAIQAKVDADQSDLTAAQSIFAADIANTPKALTDQITVKNYTQAIATRQQTLNLLSSQTTRFQSLINKDQSAIAQWTSTVNSLMAQMRTATNVPSQQNIPQSGGNSSGQTPTNANSTPDLNPDVSTADSITVTLISSKKSRIDIESSYPSTKLTIVASKKGLKKKLTYRVITKNDGTASFTTSINLLGYTVILLNGSTELDRAIGGQ